MLIGRETAFVDDTGDSGRIPVSRTIPGHPDLVLELLPVLSQITR
jgi:hypothetical protein